MRYKNTKATVRSSDGDPNFFDTMTVVLQGDCFAPYMFIICLDYVLRTTIDLMKENGFTLKKLRSRRYPVETMTETDYSDELMIFGNTPARVESLLHRKRQEALISM